MRVTATVTFTYDALDLDEAQHRLDRILATGCLGAVLKQTLWVRGGGAYTLQALDQPIQHTCDGPAEVKPPGAFKKMLKRARG